MTNTTTNTATSTMSTTAAKLIATYGITATNVIHCYRFGGERLIHFVDTGVATALDRGAALNTGLRSNLASGQQRVSRFSTQGVQRSTERAQSAVGVAVDLATKAVGLVATNAERLDRAANLNALATLSRVAMPLAQVIGTVADRIESVSSALVQRAAGNAMPAKAVAKRKLNKTTAEAAVARKTITKRATKLATQQVSAAVAEVATETSNAARRVARKATKVGADTSTAARRVAGKAAATATGASNAARRVARKAAASAQAA